jgi:hypothetical protein
VYFSAGGEENVTEIIRHGGIKPLLECISLGNDAHLIEAALRALKAIYKSPNSEKGDVFQVRCEIICVYSRKGESLLVPYLKLSFVFPVSGLSSS